MLGRTKEEKDFVALFLKKTASLVTVRGRRRIGKSTFIQQMGKKIDNFYEFQGLPPREGSSNKKQLEHFARQCVRIFHGPQVKFEDWTFAFDYLAEKIQKNNTLVLLDEISWMGRFDYDFAGKLKTAWDTQFKKNNKLVLVLCGSVSSWIKHNILNNTGFVGRISLDLRIDELSLKHSLQLAGIDKKLAFSDLEKVKFLSFTGGVPKYLEEVIGKDGPERNIERLCLSPSGALNGEFNHIFNDIFEAKAELYKRILTQLIERKLSASDLSEKLKLPLNGDLSDHLDNLVESGFICKENSWSFEKLSISKKGRYRLSDNYLRFYLKYLYHKGSSINTSITRITNWESIAGLQFENIVHKNYPSLLTSLNIPINEIVQIGAYSQQKNTKQEGCQFDLIIQTKFNVLYLCEIKAQKKIESNVILDFEKKIKRLRVIKGFSVRKVLIYAGELSTSVEDRSFFDYIVTFSDLAKN